MAKGSTLSSLLLLLLLATSCTKYQYLSFNSDLPTNKRNSFIAQGDSLIITYSFIGTNAIEIELENTSDQLVYADWSRSSVILNGESFSFEDEISKLSGTANSTQIVRGNSSIDFEGQISESSNRTYIPPKSRVSRLFTKLPIEYTKGLRKTNSFEPILLPSSARKFTFTKENSLNNIRSYIHLISDDESSSQVLKHQFWMSEIVETMDNNLQPTGNQLKESKTTAVGVVLTSIVTVAVIGVLAATEE